jgi:hypothetical protein
MLEASKCNANLFKIRSDIWTHISPLLASQSDFSGTFSALDLIRAVVCALF